MPANHTAQPSWSAFMDGELSPEETLELERKLQASPELAAEFEKFSHESLALGELLRQDCPREIIPPAPDIFLQRVMSRIETSPLPLTSLAWNEESLPMPSSSSKIYARWKTALFSLLTLSVGLAAGSWWQAYRDGRKQAALNEQPKTRNVAAPTFTVPDPAKAKPLPEPVRIPRSRPLPPAYPSRQ